MNTLGNPLVNVGRVFLICASLLFAGCSGENALRKELENCYNRLDEVESIRINRLDEQASSITSSIQEMNQVSGNLQNLISELEKQVEALKMQQNNQDMTDEIAMYELGRKIEIVRGYLTVFQERKQELDGMAANLDDYIKNNLEENDDWLESTFATLSQQDTLQNLLATLSRDVDAYLEMEGESIEDLDGVIDMLSESIQSSRLSIEDWVNEKLDDYYDVAEIDDEVQDLKKQIEDGDSPLLQQLSDLESKLNQVRKEIEETYEEAIRVAIQENNGVIKGELQASLGEVDNKINEIKTYISNLDAKINDLSTRIATVSEQLERIEKSEKTLKDVNEDIESLLIQLQNEIENLEGELDNHEESNEEKRSEIEQMIEDFKKLQSKLQKANEEFENRLFELEVYVEEELKDCSEWYEATFATLEQYFSMQKALADLRETIEEYGTGGSGSTADIDKLEKELIEKVGKSEQSMKSWVNDRLTEGYYDIAKIEAKIQDLKTSIEDGDEELDAYLQSELQAFEDKLNKFREDIIAFYEETISIAIEEGNGTFSDELEVEIKSFKEDLENELPILESKIEDLWEKVDALDGRVVSAAELIESIKESMDGFDIIDEELQAVLDKLDERADSLANAISDEVDQNAESLDSLRAAMNAIKDMIADFSELDKSFDDRLDAMSSLIEASTSQDSLKTIFSTIDQYKEIQDLLLLIQARIDAGEVSSGEYLSKITANLEDAIQASKDSMKSWVEEELAECYDKIATAQGDIEELKSQIQDNDDSSKEALNDISASLEWAKLNLINEYKDAIEKAITENEGVINNPIESALNDARNEFFSEVSRIELKIAELTREIEEMEGQVQDLLDMIQSVTYIPLYSNGVIYVDGQDKSVEMSFKISPSSSVSVISKDWRKFISVEYITTIMTKSSPLFNTLPVSSAEFDAELGVVSLVVDISGLADFYEGRASVSVAMSISDETNNILSDFIPLELNKVGEGVDLSESGTANSYIVNESGAYKFKTVKGNSSASVGTVAKAEVLWESFGTSTAPSVGDLVNNVTYADGYIAFEATDKKGNAVIAAKDATGKILWSWHIWLTDQPQAQVYYNNAGTMMDRNLGATSATPGDVGALGLLYQWGRKDPFLGSSSISSSTVAKSTLSWPSAVESTSSTGTIDYVTANPTTFVTENSNNHDWYYSDVKNETDNTRWQSSKTIYDPCPAGWRVPDGGYYDGVWSTALGSCSSFTNEELYNSTNEGMNFSGKFGTASTIWYPASGYRNRNDGGLYCVGYYGLYWSVTPSSGSAYDLGFINDGFVGPSSNGSRADGQSVRCLQE